jgi:DNA-binding NarL/FixJ family response regulator
VNGAISQRITVLVADANLMACRLLAGLLERQRDFEVVACTSDQESLLHSVKRTPVDVALIAAEWGDGRLSGLAIAQRMRELNPHCAMVLLLDETGPHLIVEAMRAGARGVFFRSEFESAALCKCVRRVYEGQIWLKSKDVKHLVDALAQPRRLQVLDAGGVNLLTNREQDVMRLVAEGFRLLAPGRILRYLSQQHGIPDVALASLPGSALLYLRIPVGISRLECARQECIQLGAAGLRPFYGSARVWRQP